MVDETQDKKIHSRDLSVGLIQGMDRLSPSLIKAMDGILWLIAILIALIFIYLVGQILFFMLDVSNSNSIQGIEEFNKVLITVGSLVGAMITLGFLVWRTMIAQKQNAIAQENIHSTTMAKAIEQLGAMKEEKVTPGRAIPDGSPPPETVTNSKPNIEVRLGAIYLLEKLAREHRDLHWPIMEILCAYVRENAGPPQAPWDERFESFAGDVERFSEAEFVEFIIEEEKKHKRPPRVDVQSALTVIGRRSEKQRAWEHALRLSSMSKYRFNLKNTHLSNTDFLNLEFSDTDFCETSLEKSVFSYACLERANFYHAILDGAEFRGAQLEQAYFGFTQLKLNSFVEASLNDADFQFAKVSASTFNWAKLCRANLLAAQISNTNFHLCDLAASTLASSQMKDCEFRGARLNDCNLRAARFESVDLGGATLDDAYIGRSNFAGVIHLAQDTLNKTWGTADTVLPTSLIYPVNSQWETDQKEGLNHEVSWQRRNPKDSDRSAACAD